MSSDSGAVVNQNSFLKIRPEVLRAGALVIPSDLVPSGREGEWKTPAKPRGYPRIKLPVRFAAGIYQLRVYLSGDERVRACVYVEEEGAAGPNATPVVEFDHATNEMQSCDEIEFERPVRAMYLEIRMSGKFRIQEFSLRTQPPLYRFVRSMYRAFGFAPRFFVRIGRLLVAWGGATQKDLKPSTLLEHLGGNNWRSLGRDPHYTATKSFSPGWVRVRARIRSDRGAVSQFYFDAGKGFDPTEAVFLTDDSGVRDITRYVYFSRPVRAVRFDPVDSVLDFTLEHFSATPISDLHMLIDAFFLKIEDMRSRRNFTRSLKYGLGLLLKFNFSEFREKLFPPDALSPQSSYEAWRVRNKMTPQKQKTMLGELKSWKNPPLISIIMPVYNVPETYLRKAVDSVFAQIYPHWELCIADDCSTAPHIRPMLEELAKRDSRVKVVYREKNGHISAASNSALELATGEFVATLDNDDEFAVHALYEVARAIINNPKLDFIYSDEDKIDMTGRHIEPFFKPDWSPDYFLACMYTCHIGVYRTALVRELGGYRSEFDTAQDYDMVLRVTEKTDRIYHITDILYHWRMLPTSTASSSDAKPKAHLTAQKALTEHLARLGEKGRIEDGISAGFHRARFEIIGKPKISIIIPSTCGPKVVDGKEINFLDRCVMSIIEKSTWREFEIIILDRNQMPAEMQARYKKLGVRRVTYDEGFNWSRVNNLGAKHATGSHLLLMNDDMEVITPDWLESMLEFSQRKGVGAVGCKLIFPDGRLQHAGVAVKQGKPGHPYYCHPGGQPGYFMSNVVHRNCIAVTGACLMARKDAFDSVGGLNEEFPLNYNDVDFCLKLIASGQRIVYTPYAKLYHFESLTRPKGVEPAEVERFEKIWLRQFPDDPFLNKHLVLVKSACIVKA